VPSAPCCRYKIGQRPGRHYNFQLQCRLAGTADFFNEMPSGRYFNFATIVLSGRHFSHCVVKNVNTYYVL